jgi:hypothetical protein
MFGQCEINVNAYFNGMECDDNVVHTKRRRKKKREKQAHHAWTISN